MKLSQDDFKKIRGWIYRNARPIDLARWKYHFENGDKSEVITALESYKNEDGGFGHGLEPDFWNPNSSPMQTWKATEILSEVGAIHEKNSIIDNILAYLDSGENFMEGFWKAAIESNNEYPHAPWWNYYEGVNKVWGYNPTVCLVGFIIAAAPKESSIYIKAEEIVKRTIGEFIQGENLDSMHQIHCFVRLYEYIVGSTYELDNLVEFKERLIDQVNGTICHDNSIWQSDYVCKPSFFIGSPKSIFYHSNKEILEVELDLLIDSLNNEGYWNPNWSWNQYEEAWSLSKNWWKADIIINNLLLLKNFHRIEE